MRLRDRLWNSNIIVFLSSACVMVIELVASRLIAPRLGVSLYTWTAVIGVILAGISLGNYLGGRLADRFASSAFLGLIFALAALSTLSILWLNNEMHTVEFPTQLPLMIWVLGYIAAVFFLPCTILGCVSPVVVKLSLKDLQRSGTTVGKIYAWSSVGSIVGTFATGFFLISWFGTKTVLLIVAGIQGLLAIWFLTDMRWWKAVLGVGVLLVAMGGAYRFLQKGDFLCKECLRETNYYCINVYNKDNEGDKVIRELVLDRLVHSYSDVNDPTNLVYGYERTYAQVIRPLTSHKPNLDAFFIGGGGYTFPRYLEATLPASHVVVAEIDPGVTQVARDMLGLMGDTRIETRDIDARIFMTWYSQPDSYDLIFGDAFNDYSVPFHLTTLEFDGLVDSLLRDDGLYVVNIIDGGQRGHFMRAYVRTLQQVFRHVAVIPSGPDWKSPSRTTFVIVASQQPYNLGNMVLKDAVLTEAELAQYMSLDQPLVLTDDHVPVDNLLAPVFADSHRS